MPVNTSSRVPKPATVMGMNERMLEIEMAPIPSMRAMGEAVLPENIRGMAASIRKLETESSRAGMRLLKRFAFQYQLYL